MSEQPNSNNGAQRDPLHGITLKVMLEKLHDHYGFEGLGIQYWLPKTRPDCAFVKGCIANTMTYSEDLRSFQLTNCLSDIQYHLDGE